MQSSSASRSKIYIIAPSYYTAVETKVGVHTGGGVLFIPSALEITIIFLLKNSSRTITVGVGEKGLFFLTRILKNYDVTSIYSIYFQ